MTDHATPKKRSGATSRVGELAGILIVAVQAGFMVLAVYLGGPSGDSRFLLLNAVAIWLWGLTFAAAYRWPHANVLFRGLMWVCERASYPSGRFMALVYATLCLILGTVSWLQAVGAISGRSH